jgi:hypothetical protein
MEFKSELLCYIQNYFGNSSQKGLITTISGFFTSEEIMSAKISLFRLYESLPVNGHVDGIGKHRMIQRKSDDQLKKRELDTADIIALYSDLDKVKAQLPVFTAANLKRIPNFAPDATDICSLTMNVAVLQSQMIALQQAFNAVTSTASTMGDLNLATVSMESAVTPPSESSSSAGASVYVANASNTWAEVTTKNADKWSTVGVNSSKRPQPQPKIKLCGSKTTVSQNNAEKAVPRKKVLAAYVGRLHIDTSEEDLTQYLLEEGITGVVCKRLHAKNGQTFTTAAFYVTCCEESRDLFYKDSCWPEGTELRDWVYYHK